MGLNVGVTMMLVLMLKFKIQPFYFELDGLVNVFLSDNARKVYYSIFYKFFSVYTIFFLIMCKYHSIIVLMTKN